MMESRRKKAKEQQSFALLECRDTRRWMQWDGYRAHPPALTHSFIIWVHIMSYKVWIYFLHIHDGFRVCVCRVPRRFCSCRSAGGSTLSSPLLVNRTRERPASFTNAHTRSCSKCVSPVNPSSCPIMDHSHLKQNKHKLKGNKAPFVVLIYIHIENVKFTNRDHSSRATEYTRELVWR